MGQDNSVPLNPVFGEMPAVPEDTTGWKYNYHVILQPGKVYRIESWEVGTFTLKGGSSGYFTFEASKATKGNTGPPTLLCQIRDDADKIVLSLGESSTEGRLTVQDNPDWTTSVIYTQGGTPARNIPIPVRVNSAKEVVDLMGRRDFTVSGNGASLRYSGSGNVTIDGNPAGIEYEGSGEVTINGEVTGDVNFSGCGHLMITGDVLGKLTQETNGRIDVMGVVFGDIFQIKNGSILVNKSHVGKLVKAGKGYVQIGQREDNFL